MMVTKLLIMNIVSFAFDIICLIFFLLTMYLKSGILCMQAFWIPSKVILQHCRENPQATNEILSLGNPPTLIQAEFLGWVCWHILGTVLYCAHNIVLGSQKAIGIACDVLCGYG